MSAQPALLLVHGAYHGPWVWDRVIEQLPGVAVHTVACPSSGSDLSKLGTLQDDIDAVTDAVDAIGGPVVVVAHSYAGVVVSDAVAGMDNVVRIVYIAAAMVDPGESIMGAAGGMPPWWQISKDEGPDGGIIRVAEAQATDVFYGDVAPELAAEAVARLVPASYSSQTASGSKAAWHEIPSTYVICTADNALPASAQEAMARQAANVHRLPSSHSPFLSMPAELAAILRAELTLGVNAS
jgi:pimeloyl-ACP methyl ester carboxylesterase